MQGGGGKGGAGPLPSASRMTSGGGKGGAGPLPSARISVAKGRELTTRATGITISARRALANSKPTRRFILEHLLGGATCAPRPGRDMRAGEKFRKRNRGNGGDAGAIS